MKNRQLQTYRRVFSRESIWQKPGVQVHCSGIEGRTLSRAGGDGIPPVHSLKSQQWPKWNTCVEGFTSVQLSEQEQFSLLPHWWHTDDAIKHSCQTQGILCGLQELGGWMIVSAQLSQEASAVRLQSVCRKSSWSHVETTPEFLAPNTFQSAASQLFGQRLRLWLAQKLIRHVDVYSKIQHIVYLDENQPQCFHIIDFLSAVTVTVGSGRSRLQYVMLQTWCVQGPPASPPQLHSSTPV